MTNHRTNRRTLKGGIALVIGCLVGGSLTYHFLFAQDRSVIGLWLTPDQQGRYYFEKGDYKVAAERFQDPLWKGISYYRTKNLEGAIEQFSRVNTAEGYFNLGDAYAHLGQLEQALANYEEALRRKPGDIATKENRALVQSLIQKKKAKKKEEEAPEGQEPIYNPDEIKFDEKGKKGKKGEIDQAQLSAEQTQELWMRRLQTTPSDFLRLKFAAQAEESRMSRPQDKPQGGK